MRQDSLYKEAADTYGASLDRLARAYEFDPEARRDLLQDIHLHLWRSFAHFDQRCSRRTWVYRVAQNVATGYVIRQRRVGSRLVSVESIEALPGSGQSELAASRSEALERLSLLIQRLKPHASSAKEDCMPSEFPMHDPQKTWQNQPTEPFKMSMNEIRGKVRQGRTKARLEALLSITTGLMICVFLAWTFARSHGVLPRLGLGLLSLCGVNFAYQAYRWIWPRRLGPDATVSTSVKFYRSELERRRDYGVHIWLRGG